ncbi:MAG: TonB-dependent receptor [Acidobacteriota bacterium]
MVKGMETAGKAYMYPRVLLVFLLCVATVSAADYQGQVLFNDHGIPGATVSVSRGDTKFSTTTDPNGRYSFTELADGVWTVRIEMQAFSAVSRDVSIGPETAPGLWEMNLLPLDRIQDLQVQEPVAENSIPETSDASAGAEKETAAENNTDTITTPRFVGTFGYQFIRQSSRTVPFFSNRENISGNAGISGNNRGLVRSLYNGSIGFNFRSSALDARSYSLTGIDTPEPAYSQISGTAYFGGPLHIPRLVRNGPTFYAGYQFARNRNVQTRSGLVPTQSERNGDLSRSPGQIFDPASGLPLADNMIPIDRISPQAAALLKLYPLPNFSGNSQYNYQIPVVNVTHQDSVFGNLNKTVGTRNRLYGTFAIQSSRAENPTLLGFFDTSRSLGLNLSANWQYNFTPRFVGTFGYQFIRQSSRTVPFLHNISFGEEYRRMQVNLLSQQDPRGSFTFTGASTAGPTPGTLLPGALNDLAGFLLGVPDTLSIAFGNADKYFRSSAFAAYFADDWRMTSNFTLNLGIRYEYTSPIAELYGRLVNLDIAPGFTSVAPVVADDPVGSISGADYPTSLVRPYKRAFQPRLAFAWKPLSASSLLVRGGYGIYYNSSPYQAIAMQMSQQSPLSKSLSLQNSSETPLTLADGFNQSPSTTANTFAVDPDLRIGYVHIWQLSLQFDMPGALQLTATYEGSRGRNALQEFLPNSYPAGAVNPCTSCPSGFRYRVSGGTSSRESGTIQLRRRLYHGFTATAQYAFSKSIDDAAPGAAGSTGSVFIAQNWRNPAGERALSSFDQRHAATFQLQYTTGIGSRGGMFLSGWGGALFKQWTLSSQISTGSGLPLTPVYPVAVAGTGVSGPVRPDYTGADIYDAPPGLYLNPDAYRAPATGHWGSAARNSITGPSTFTLSASLHRTFQTSASTNCEVGVDVSNLLNHVSFTSWNTTLGSARFGLPTSANGMRNVQTTIRWRF